MGAIVFSLGLIAGQRILVEDGFPPAVATGPDTPALSTATEHDGDIDDDSEKANLFSFYDALTASDTDVADPDFGDDAEPPSPEDGDDVDLSDAARFTLQIASHPTMERARTEMDRLRSLDLEPKLIAEEGPEGAEIYEIRVGKFPTTDGARSFMERLESEHDIQAVVTSL